MKRFVLYLESLEKRERFLLIAGLYGIVIVVGIFFLTMPNIQKIEKIDKKISKEMERYNYLLKLTSQYITFKPVYKKGNLSLSFIENLAKNTGVYEYITSLKPFKKDSVELTFERIDGNRLTNFIKLLKNNNLKITSFSMEDPKGNGELNVRILISR